ncbi:glycosyltransferase family 4 protein [Entomobacter blattae]|uniref:D-inositol-3-phosphate glycosyltransferase n=1 Tax=Entomobacter blattae TaxID=2762277 RepID=A0A7H1NUW6_9PROT|nr:glycosyltransferase family 4 protein [Entomobacter blattae]QNT79576.1 D-inositol-3-phosphate glycosyltransferase [Entomobacter blattae]
MGRASFRQAVILQVLPALNGGGVERGTVEMAEAITKAGGKALVVSAGGKLLPQLRRAGGQHIPLPVGKKDVISLYRHTQALKRIIEAEGVDVVHARSRAPAWCARWAARKVGRALVTTWHGVHGETFPGKKYYNAVLASGDRVIAISEFIAQRLHTHYNVQPDRLRLIPRGADMEYFDPLKVTGMQIHELALKWYIPIDSYVVMLPARLTEWKGHGWFFHTLGFLKKQGLLPANWLCVCVGEIRGHEPYANKLLALAEELGIASHVRLVGHCSQMSIAYALADIVVIPSLKPEPFGRVAIEAQAMQCLVIAAAHGGLKETVMDGVTGFLVPPHNNEAMAARLLEIMAMPLHSRQEMGIRARDFIKEHYSTSLMQQRTLSVYNELLPPSLQLTQDDFLITQENGVMIEAESKVNTR